MSKPTPIEVTLLKLARPGMDAKELLRAVKALHPEAKKKDITHAAFAAVLTMAGSDIDKALMLQDFAIRGRASDD